MSAVLDETSARLYTDRFTYRLYWNDDDTLTDWAIYELALIHRITERVGQNPDETPDGHLVGLDLAQAQRIAAFASVHGITTRHPRKGKLVDRPLDLEALSPWFGLVTNAPFALPEAGPKAVAS